MQRLQSRLYKYGSFRCPDPLFRPNDCRLSRYFFTRSLLESDVNWRSSQCKIFHEESIKPCWIKSSFVAFVSSSDIRSAQAISASPLRYSLQRRQKSITRRRCIDSDMIWTFGSSANSEYNRNQEYAIISQSVCRVPGLGRTGTQQNKPNRDGGCREQPRQSHYTPWFGQGTSATPSRKFHHGCSKSGVPSALRASGRNGSFAGAAHLTLKIVAASSRLMGLDWGKAITLQNPSSSG